MHAGSHDGLVEGLAHGGVGEGDIVGLRRLPEAPVVAGMKVAPHQTETCRPAATAPVPWPRVEAVVQLLNALPIGQIEQSVVLSGQAATVLLQALGHPWWPLKEIGRRHGAQVGTRR